MTRRLLSFLLGLALLAGCVPLQRLAGALVTPTPAPTRRPTPTRPLPPTSTPTIAVPTATPIIPLKEDGPWLTYLAASKQGMQVVAANSDGSGRVVVTAFSDLYVPQLARPTAPGSSWFSLLNGRDSTLTLFELPAGAARETYHLLSNADLSADQRQLYASILVQDTPPSLSWSPNGRYLAFMGAMDGPYTDVYLFDSQDGSSRRLTERLGESYFPAWSPDGKTLLVQECQDAGGRLLVQAVDALTPEDDGLAVLYRPKSYGEDIFGWLDGQTFLVASRRQAGLVEARRYSLEERRHSQLQYAGLMQNAVMDPTRGVLAFITPSTDKNVPSLSTGLYWTSSITGAVPVARGQWSRLAFLPAARRFFAVGAPGVLSFAPNSEKITYSGEENLPAASPDGKLLAFFSPESARTPGLRLYTPDGKRSVEVTNLPVQEVLWQPDSSALLFVSGGDLYAAGLSGAQPSRLDTGVSSLGWVGGR